jgi:hypothetical protein
MALGAALMAFGQGMRQRRDYNQSREDRMAQLEEERMWREQQRQDQINRWLAEDERNRFQEARQLREDLGPGAHPNLPPEVQSKLGKAGFGYEETTLPSKAIGPSAGGGLQMQDSPARAQFYIPSNFKERAAEEQRSAEAAARAEDQYIRRQQLERQEQLDADARARAEREWSQVSPAQLALMERQQKDMMARIDAQMGNRRDYLDPQVGLEWEIIKATEPGEFADPAERQEWQQRIRDFQLRNFGTSSGSDPNQFIGPEGGPTRGPLTGGRGAGGGRSLFDAFLGGAQPRGSWRGPSR